MTANRRLGFFQLSWIKVPGEERLLPIYSVVNYTEEELNARFMERQFVAALRPFKNSGFEAGGFVLFKEEVIAFPEKDSSKPENPLDSPCQHVARNGVHELYLAGDGMMVCRACGRRGPMR